MTNESELDRRCARYGVDIAYADIWGHVHAVPDATKRAVLDAMGVSRGGDAVQKPSILPVAQVLEEDAPAELVATFDVSTTPSPRLRFRVSLESGGVIDDNCAPRFADRDSEGFHRYRIAIPMQLPAGYHDFELYDDQDARIAASRLIVAPSRCFGGSGRAARARMFGPVAQVYALRSRRNWGIGDFTDLRLLIEIAAANGADLVGINPLHALFADRPQDCSPYSPSNRTMLNPLYLDVEAIEDFSACGPAREQVLSASFQRRLAAARATDLVDYPTVTSLKYEILERLYRHFREHDANAGTARGLAFRGFQQRGGDALLHHALFEALAEAHRERIEFFQYLQWQAHLQLADVAAHARQAGMAIGLYRDLAVGADASGSEAWRDPSLFARDMHVGAPPDEFNQKGQDWGLPPWIPQQIAQHRYEPWIDVLRANMHCAGALRIDHVMGLMRLYWIPAGASARDGAYVHYPFEALLGVLALESERARCIVVGEDLGTVPDAVRNAMARLGILSYRVLLFEHAADGSFARPEAYPGDALCTFSTHDLPTLHGFLLEADLKTRDALRLFPNEAMRAQQYALRREDRQRLRAALRDAGLLGGEAVQAGSDALTFDQALGDAVHAYLARTPSRLMTFQLEDVFGVVEQTNMPSTTGERHPNWRRKLPLELEAWEADGRFSATCAAIRAQSRGK